MVMFRDFVQGKARNLGIVGTVQNVSDGTVKVVVQGEKTQLIALLQLLHQGPMFAKVKGVTVVWRDPSKTFSDFQILY